jgi:hypothetical protein
MAFRFNKLTSTMPMKFTIKLNSKTFIIHVFGTLGEVNGYLKED